MSLAPLLAAEGLDPAHPAEIEHAAAQAVARPWGPLTDLRHLPFVTIDERTSKDLDQALFIAPDGDGHVVWYALADASWVAPPGSALFDEALRRGASLYLPGLVVPMLPRLLSEDQTSLLPGVDRRAMVFEVRLDARAEVRSTQVHRAVVHSRQKLAYIDVQAHYDGRPSPVEAPEIVASLAALAVVGERRTARAEERAVVRFRRTELDVRFDGLRFVAAEDVRLPVERHNEQISVLCNAEGARLLGTTDALAIYRVQDPPDAEAEASLRRQIRAILDAHGRADLDWGDEPLATWLDRLPEDRLGAALHRQALVIGGEASFRAAPGAHFGVGVAQYARFTAPMREVVGIWLHAQLLAALGFGDTPGDPSLRDAVITASNTVHLTQKRLNRAVNRLVLDTLFASATEPLPGTLMGLADAKAHVRLDDPPVDVKIYLRDLPHAETDETTLRTADTTVRVGDPVVVAVLGQDAERDRWRLALHAQ